MCEKNCFYFQNFFPDGQLNVINSTIDDAGTYECKAAYENITIFSKNINIQVVDRRNKKVSKWIADDDFTFICFAFNNKNITYKWYKDEKEIDFR